MMFLTCGKYLFELIGVGIAVVLSLQVFFPDKMKNMQDAMPLLGGLFMLYVLSGILLILLVSSVLKEVIILLFILSPFIIGKLVKYEKLKLYSIIQILCAVLSVGFVACM